ncbi:MAG: hypothetical protein ACE5IC_02280 [Candidatus Brocadiales bacterium]
MAKRLSALPLQGKEGFSLVALIAILTILATVGAVYTSIMSRWQTSAPITRDSTKALYLAELYAQLGLIFLKDNVSYQGSVICQTNTTIPDISNMEKGAYGICGPAETGVPDLYRITAIGAVGTGLPSPSTWWNQATCDYDIPSSASIRALKKITVDVYKTGERIDMPRRSYVEGTISNIKISNETGDYVIYATDGTVAEGDPTGLVENVIPIDADTVIDAIMRMAICQNGSCGNHFYLNPGGGVSWGPSQDGWPCDENGATGSFYYHDDADEAKDVPNVIYVNGDFTISGNTTIRGIVVVEGGDFNLTGTATLEGILVFRGDGRIVGGADPGTPETFGVIAYGSLEGQGSNIEVRLNESYYDALDNIASSNIAIDSWEEEVSS